MSWTKKILPNGSKIPCRRPGRSPLKGGWAVGHLPPATSTRTIKDPQQVQALYERLGLRRKGQSYRGGQTR